MCRLPTSSHAEKDSTSSERGPGVGDAECREVPETPCKPPTISKAHWVAGKSLGSKSAAPRAYVVLLDRCSFPTKGIKASVLKQILRNRAEVLVNHQPIWLHSCSHDET